VSGEKASHAFYSPPPLLTIVCLSPTKVHFYSFTGRGKNCQPIGMRVTCCCHGYCRQSNGRHPIPPRQSFLFGSFSSLHLIDFFPFGIELGYKNENRCKILCSIFSMISHVFKKNTFQTSINIKVKNKIAESISQFAYFFVYQNL